MPVELEKTYNNTKLKDPNWYTSLFVDFLDCKWGGVAKELSKALQPQSIDVANQLATMFVDAFNQLDAAQGFAAKCRGEYTRLFDTHVIDADFPTHHPLFSILLNELKQKREQLENYDINTHKLNDLRASFSSNFNNIRHQRNSKFEQAHIYLEELTREKPLETKVINHINNILYDVEHAPLAIDHRMSLLQSYVSPSCTTQIGASSNSYDCLMKELINLIEQSVKPIVLHGQPGHGKTSSVRMLVRTLCGLYAHVAAPPITLLFEFRRLHNLNRPVIDVLKENCSFITNEAFFTGRSTVLIFDGLDERQAAEGGSDDYLKSFVRELFYLANKVNNQDTSRLNLVVTGRSQYVGQIKSAFVSPHYIIDIDDFDQSRQEVWLTKFNQQTKAELDYSQFEQHQLDDLVSQPILLSISALMLTDVEGKRLLARYGGQQLNRAMVYHTIIEWAYNKQWHDERYLETWKDDIAIEDYFILLQAIAFEMFRAGEETLQISTLTAALKNNASQLFHLDRIGDKWLNNLEELLKHLRISFFFKGVEDKAFAFIHKSIKDFLLVSGLVDAAQSLFEDFNPRKPDRLDDELVALFGANPLSAEDHFGFLREWLTIKANNMKDVEQAAYHLSRRVIENTFHINHVYSAKEQSELLAITTHNLLQLVSRWFITVKDKSFYDPTSEVFQIFSMLEQHEVDLMLRTQDLFLNVYDKQHLDEFVLFGERYNLSLANSEIFNIMLSGQIRWINLENAKISQLYISGGSLEFSCLSGNGEIGITTDGNVPIYFFNCDFSGRTIKIDEYIVKPIFINCNFDNATLVDTEKMEIKEQAEGFKPLDFVIV